MHSVIIYTLAYKRPDLYYLQLQMMKRFVKDFYAVAITSVNNHNKIKKMFRDLQIDGEIRITDKEKRNKYTYEIPYECMEDYQKQYCNGKKYDWMLFLDDDVIPIAPFTFKNQARFYDKKYCQFIMNSNFVAEPITEVPNYRDGLAEIIDENWYHWDKASGSLSPEKTEEDYKRYKDFIENYELKDSGYIREEIKYKNKGEFFDSEVCKSLLHCNSCRFIENWRKEIGRRWKVDNIDWVCPLGFSGNADGIARRDGKGQVWKDVNTD